MPLLKPMFHNWTKPDSVEDVLKIKAHPEVHPKITWPQNEWNYWFRDLAGNDGGNVAVLRIHQKTGEVEVDYNNAPKV